MGLPTLTVLLEDSTGSFTVDVSSRVLAADGFSISCGRSDWQDSVTAGELGLTLNNSDGVLTSGAGFDTTGFDTDAFGGSGMLAVDRRIRLQETINGTTYPRFTGYVKSVPVEWPAVVSSFATVRLSATDAQARAERWTLKSMLEEEILLRSPERYYTLSEPDGSTSAGDSSGNQAAPLTLAGSGAAVAFGQGTGPTDGLSAVQFTGGQYLSDGVNTVSTNPTVFTLFAAFATTSTSGFVVRWRGIAISLDVSGHATGAGPNIITSSIPVNDGNTHEVMLVGDGTTTTMYVDGVAAGTGATVAQAASDELKVGDGFIGTVSHVATYTTALSAFEASQIFAVVKGATETVHNRMQRFVGYGGIQVTQIGLADDPFGFGPGHPVSAQATSGKSLWDAMQEVATAEGGILYGGNDGAFVFQGREWSYGKNAPDLILDSQYVTPDVVPVTDDQQIVNYVDVTAAGTGAATLVQDVDSQTAHGRYPASYDYIVPTDAEAIDRATWTITKLAEPNPRYGTLTINLYKMTPSLAATVVNAIAPDCWLRVTSMASQNPDGTTTDVMVQGWREEASATTWTLTCNVVSRSLYTALILDDPTFGVLDSYPILY